MECPSLLALCYSRSRLVDKLDMVLVLREPPFYSGRRMGGNKLTTESGKFRDNRRDRLWGSEKASVRNLCCS